MLKGFRTKIIAGLVTALGIAKMAGWIDPHLYDTIVGLLAGAGLWTLRDAIPKG